jgi:hypothetical protein
MGMLSCVGSLYFYIHKSNSLYILLALLLTTRGLIRQTDTIYAMPFIRWSGEPFTFKHMSEVAAAFAAHYFNSSSISIWELCNGTWQAFVIRLMQPK